MEITEEQRRRAEANRLSALEKRKRAAEGLEEESWRLVKCRETLCPTTMSSSLAAPEKKPALPPRPSEPMRAAERFLVVLEICSPDEFAVSPVPLPGFAFPGAAECFQIIEAALSSALPFRVSESQGSQGSLRAFVYKLIDYDSVLKCLKKLLVAELHDIPYTTLLAIRTFQDYAAAGLIPCWKEHYFEGQVDDMLERMPRSLRDALLPFQLEGVRFGLRRGARCLIADEMGLGKTLQAIAIACCFRYEGPILIVCPAVLRFSWAEELEHWLPFLLPKDIHLVFGHQNNLDYLERSPKFVVISYTMLSRLRKSMLNRDWALLVVDESHNTRCTKKKIEPVETKTVLDIATKINRIILLSGTPSLTRPYDIYHQVNMLWPGLLGKDKYEFARNYCITRVAQGQGNLYKDLSKGNRLEELNVLLRQYVMIRRLKEHVLAQLPPKRRQIITFQLKSVDISLAMKLCGVNCVSHLDDDTSNQSLANGFSDQNDNDGDDKLRNLNACNDKNFRRNTKLLSFQEVGIAKLSGFREWFYNHVAVRESEDANFLGTGLNTQKMIIFAHHIKVLDKIQEFVCEKGIKFVRIDGRTLPKDRQAAVDSFRLASEVKIAIIGITAGGIGLDFSTAQNVVFLELPKSASEMLQAEDRAHRRGQTNAVNIYIFCAKGTSDESHWLYLNKSLSRVSSMMNGKHDAVKEIEVNEVFQLDHSVNTVETEQEESMGMLGCKFGECESITTGKFHADLYGFSRSQPLDLELYGARDSDLGLWFALNKNGESSDNQYLHLHHSEKPCVVVKEGMEHDLEITVPEEENRSGPTSAENDDVKMLDAGIKSLIQENSLRFEVSHNTGRIHLYICIPGKDLRPRSLSVNFRQEELNSIIFSCGEVKKEAATQLLKEYPSYGNIFQKFIKEWSNLRPIERHKLLGKPLQLPLSLELCYLKETVNHGSYGLLKGGSKRRVTPLSEISCSLPENAVWKKVVLRSGSSKEKEYTQAWTLCGKPLCKLCHAPCNGNLSTTPEFFEDLFCDMNCYQEYRVRTSQKALREALFQIEHGVCVECNLDCHKLVKSIRPLSLESRRKYMEQEAPALAMKKKLLEKLVNDPVEGNAWHADHIVPVFRGGGECRVENMRTLCVACHAEVTKAQRSEQHLARKKAKEQLKMTMKGLETIEAAKHTEFDLTVAGPDAVAGPDEDDLLVQVPGSAYSES